MLYAVAGRSDHGSQRKRRPRDCIISSPNGFFAISFRRGSLVLLVVPFGLPGRKKADMRCRCRRRNQVLSCETADLSRLKQNVRL